MHLREEQINRLAESVINALSRDDLMTLKAERGALVAAVRSAVGQDLKQEEELERDAERLLEQTLRSMGKGSVEIDRHKMLRMIKEKLAKERRIVL